MTDRSAHPHVNSPAEIRKRREAGERRYHAYERRIYDIIVTPYEEDFSGDYCVVTAYGQVFIDTERSRVIRKGIREGGGYGNPLYKIGDPECYYRTTR